MAAEDFRLQDSSSSHNDHPQDYSRNSPPSQTHSLPRPTDDVLDLAQGVTKTPFFAGEPALSTPQPPPQQQQQPPPPHSITDNVTAAIHSLKVASSHRTTKYRPATDCVFVDPETEGGAIRDPYNASSVPIYQTATFKQSSADEMGEYDYSRSGNPTRTHVEAHLAKLMAAKRAFVVSSGMSALDIICRLVNAGEHVISGDDLYGGTNRLLNFMRTHNNVTVHHVDTTSLPAIQARLSSKTRLVLLETPTNPLIKIADVEAISQLVHQHSPDALVVVDNTMMSPYLQKPLTHGADIVYHSGTKYLSGHHDLMAGVVGVKDEALAAKIYFVINATGCGLAPFDCFLLMRGVKTLALRMDKQQANAQRIADHLEQRHGLKVRFPGLKSHPQYEIHNRLARGPGAVLSFETGNVEVSKKVVEAAKLWTISVSFGCVNSLISMPCCMSHASIPAHVRKERAMPEDLIRLCVGIEDADDLIEDLDNALHSAGYTFKGI
ncbi:cystathionine beta-lyase [Powellomyces hirtus]|uniref:Cystathionine beta-lyase n=1 Tax=Powellomyces hirtus TaxID=109895 RepID=A0A507DUT4_9FUNG|nr:cystathionine beta-lyase [Powellomyces hirtus]